MRVSHCVIFGAGASYGYDESLPKDRWPPLTNRLMDSESARDLLAQSRYGRLKKGWEEYVDRSRGQKLEPDPEVFGGLLASEALDGSRGMLLAPGTSADRFHTVSALSYFLYELFQPYIREYRYAEDNYRLVAKHFLKDQFVVISLNYDPLFELATLTEGVGYCYVGIEKPAPGIRVFKPHGSANWLFPMGRIIAFSDLQGDELFEAACSANYSLGFSGFPINAIHPGQYGFSSLEWVLNRGDGHSIPALLPPLGSAKEYDKFGQFTRIWALLTEFLRGIDRVTLVGTSLRGQDVRFCDALKSSLPPSAKYTLVGGVERLRLRMLELGLLGPTSPVTTYETFATWAKTL